eukprot:1285772-Pyramimonas_sp.AAC.1
MMDAYSYIDPPSEREAKEIVFQDVTKEHPTFDAAHLRIAINTLVAYYVVYEGDCLGGCVF